MAHPYNSANIKNLVLFSIFLLLLLIVIIIKPIEKLWHSSVTTRCLTVKVFRFAHVCAFYHILEANTLFDVTDLETYTHQQLQNDVKCWLDVYILAILIFNFPHSLG